MSTVTICPSVATYRVDNNQPSNYGTWNAHMTASGQGAEDVSGDANGARVELDYSLTASEWDYSERLLLVFDTSDIPATADILRADILYWPYNDQGDIDDWGDIGYRFISTTYSGGVAVASDWEKIGSTAYTAKLSVREFFELRTQFRKELTNDFITDFKAGFGDGSFEMMVAFEPEYQDSEPTAPTSSDYLQMRFWPSGYDTSFGPRLYVEHQPAAQSVTPGAIANGPTVPDPEVGQKAVIIDASPTVPDPTISYTLPTLPKVTPPAIQLDPIFGEMVSYVPSINPPFEVYPERVFASIGDDGSTQRLHLRQAGDEPLPLGEADSITVHVSDSDGTLVTEWTAGIVSVVEGTINFVFDKDDLQGSDEYRLEVEVDWGGSEISRLPSDGYVTLHVTGVV